jgi:hypothetical protein
MWKKKHVDGKNEVSGGAMDTCPEFSKLCLQLEQLVEELDKLLKDEKLDVFYPSSVFVTDVIVEAHIRRDVTLDELFVEKLEALAESHGFRLLSFKAFPLRGSYLVYLDLSVWLPMAKRND